MISGWKRRATCISFIVLIFMFFWVFLTRLHPIALLDTDSWYYAYYHRHAWPIWQLWNPARVFPEVFMPLVSAFCAYVIYPITHDYFYALTLGYAFVVSASVTALCWMVFRHFRREGTGLYGSAALTLLFLICHFLILCSDKSNNKYMLLTENTCTYFYYVLPNLWNCILVLWLMDDPKLLHFFSKDHFPRKAAFLFLAYFCLFSNIWASMISGIYAAVTLLTALAGKGKRAKGWFAAYVREHAVLLIILVLWALAQWFEINGGRAGQIKTFHFRDALLGTLRSAKATLSTVSYPFRWMTVILCAGGVGVTLWTKHWNGMKAALHALIASSLVAFYLLLSCAVAAPVYIQRPDTFYGFFFYVMLVILTAFAQMLRHVPRLKLIVPILLMVLAWECTTGDVTYRNSMYFNLPASVCYQVSNDIMEQIKTACEAGQAETVLYVPHFNDGDNWPLATYAKKRIPTHLYKMGLLPRNITVSEIIPTEDKNTQFHIKIG